MGYQKPPIGSKLNYGSPFAQKLDACWLFNEKSGNRIYDYSGNMNAGIFYSASETFTSGWSYGDALAFDGSDYIEVPDSDFLERGSKDFTINIWFYTNTVTGAHRIFDLGPVAAGYTSLMVYQNATAAQFYATSAGTSWDVASALAIGTIAIGKWYNIVVTRKGDLFSSYLNLVPGATTSNSSALYNGTAGLIIGRFGPGTSQYINGRISLITFYSRALTFAEIVHLYSFPYCMFDYQYPAYWAISEAVAENEFVKVGGVWRSSPSQMVKVGGEWKTVSSVQVKNNGLWKAA